MFIDIHPSPDRLPRVLHLVETLEIGGTETQVVETAIRQHSTGQPVTVGCLRAQGPLRTHLQGAGVPIIEFRKGKRLFSIQGVRQLFRLARFLRRQRFHVLHAHDLMSNLVGVPAARLAGTPVIISSRRYLADLEWWSGRTRNRIAGWIHKWSTHVIVNSTSIRDLLVAREGVRRDQIHLLYNGIDLHPFVHARPNEQKLLLTVPKDSKLIAVVANMESSIKGHASLITAARKVCHSLPSVVFVLIGDGQKRPELEQQVRNAGLGQNFIFLGSRADVPELLACCDLAVLPSESEGLPNAILEYMAAGLGVIATSVGGVPELIETEVSGLLVPPGNSETLAGAILRLLNDDELRQRLAAAGHDRAVKRFGFERLINELQVLYLESGKPLLAREKREHELVLLSSHSSVAKQGNE